MKPLHLAALAFLLAADATFAQQPAPPPKPPLGVPTDAQYFDGKWYRVYLDQLTWKDAKPKCERLGGRLAVIHDAPTAAFIQTLAKKMCLWLGAYEKVEGQWLWVDGSPLDYDDWVEGQPDDTQVLDMLMTWHGGWADNRNTDKGVVGFICQWKGK